MSQSVGTVDRVDGAAISASFSGSFSGLVLGGVSAIAIRLQIQGSARIRTTARFFAPVNTYRQPESSTPDKSAMK